MQRIKKSARIDMTTGPILVNVLRFMLPLLATNLLQQLYHSADMMIVGLSPEPDAVGAIGSTGTYLGLIRNLFIGFSAGANIVIAKHIGAEDRVQTSMAVHTSICMSALFGIVGAAVGIAFTRPILVLMGISGNLLTLAVRYSYIYLACMPFLSLTNFLSAILNAQGNTKTPLTVLTATGLLNVGLNLLFVLGCGMSVEGVAIATAISNAASCCILWIYLGKKGDSCHIQLRELRISREQFADIAKIGFPAGIQNTMFSLSNLLIQSSIVQVNNALTPVGSAYEPVIKGHSAAISIESFVMSALGAVGTTASAFTAQNIGARNYRRVKKVFVEICLITAGSTLILTTPVILFREQLLALYGVKNSNDLLAQIAYTAAETLILYKWTMMIPFALMNACFGTIRGMGKSAFSAVIALVGTCAFRVVWILTVFRHFETLAAIYISYPISWVITGLFAFGVVLHLIRKKTNQTPTISKAS